MASMDYFFVTEAKKSDIYDGLFIFTFLNNSINLEWKLAQKYTLQNSPLYRPLKEDQIPDKQMSNGERMIRKINVIYISVYHF